MPSFSEQLRHEAEPIWRRIFDHPFLKEIKDGTLPLATFQYYLAQDYLYLEGFGRTVAMALAKAPDSQTFEDLAHRVMTPVERPLHHKLFEVAGLTISDAEAPYARRSTPPTWTTCCRRCRCTASVPPPPLCCPVPGPTTC